MIPGSTHGRQLLIWTSICNLHSFEEQQTLRHEAQADKNLACGVLHEQFPLGEKGPEKQVFHLPESGVSMFPQSVKGSITAEVCLLSCRLCLHVVLKGACRKQIHIWSATQQIEVWQCLTPPTSTTKLIC